ncbi:hypothetical protein JW926_06685 [Candidatus Sumerlaeota bacterium]|nr:hypothetical protein [Candidatus Sumerlaeota bacterium]
MDDICPICGITECKKIDQPVGSGKTRYECKNCGKFFFDESLEAAINNKPDLDQKKISLLSHTIWKMQGKGREPELNFGFYKSILDNAKLPNPAEQADNAILYLGGISKYPAEFQPIIFDHFYAKIGALFNRASIHYILQSLSNKNLIEIKTNKGNINLNDTSKCDLYSNLEVRLSFEGWEKYEELRKGISESKKAFMAMPFGGKYKDDVRAAYESFQNAVSETGFDLSNPLLEEPEAGLIDDRLRVEVRLAKFLVADLTGNNRGVYWESGFAEGLGKKVIYTCEKDYFNSGEIHFDTNHLQTVLWEKDKLHDASQQLKAIIRNTFPGDAKME